MGHNPHITHFITHEVATKGGGLRPPLVGNLLICGSWAMTFCCLLLSSSSLNNAELRCWSSPIVTCAVASAMRFPPSAFATASRASLTTSRSRSSIRRTASAFTASTVRSHSADTPATKRECSARAVAVRTCWDAS